MTDCMLNNITISMTSCLNSSMGLNDSGLDCRRAPRSLNSFIWTIVNCILWSLICIIGSVGNGLVIFVVVRYAKMKTVTNMYILNLAVADLCFLVGLPFLITTAALQNWIFGFFMCKVFYILTSINWYTSVFTLTVMSADRYMAVCHPVRSLAFRTPMLSRLVCTFVWIASLLVMLPITMCATLTTNPCKQDQYSCTLQWPSTNNNSNANAFIWYSLLLGFAGPTSLISIFYALVVIRLKNVGPKNKSKEKKKSYRRVTKMVLIVIAVYVICWLPYWVFQVALTFDAVTWWSMDAFQIITVMSYANSMLNPVLYAFLSVNFRKSFIKAFQCASPTEVNSALQPEQSFFPGVRKGRQQQTEETIEFATTTTNQTSNTTATNNVNSNSNSVALIKKDKVEKQETAVDSVIAPEKSNPAMNNSTPPTQV